jgi:hypothetical protein
MPQQPNQRQNRQLRRCEAHENRPEQQKRRAQALASNLGGEVPNYYRIHALARTRFRGGRSAVRRHRILSIYRVGHLKPNQAREISHRFDGVARHESRSA